MSILVTMVRKETRELRRVGLVALGIVGGAKLLSFTIFNTGTAGFDIYTSGPSFSLFTFTSALVGLLLGMRVVAADARGDARALAIHRPVSATMVFASKAIAASLLYLMATLIPLAVYALRISAPGYQPAPFDARLLLPDVADLTCGLVYVAAGMLYGMRTPRWFGGRILSVGSAIITSGLVIAVDRFWQAELIVLAGLLLVLASAWSTFIHHGGYETQSIAGRATTGIVMAAGLKIAGTIAFTLFVVLGSWAIHKEMFTPRRTTTVIARDGSVVRMTAVNHPFSATMDVVAVTDLEGHPLPALLDSAAHPRALTRGVKSTAEIPLSVSGWMNQPMQGNGYRGTQDYFVRLLQSTSPRMVPTAWYFIRDRGLIAGYDVRTSRLIGWLGPDGFSPGPTEPAHRFQGELRPYIGFMGFTQPLLAFPRDVYRIDLPKYSVRHVFSAAAGEEITGAAEGRDSVIREFIRGNGVLTERDSEPVAGFFDAIATTRATYVQSPAGERVLAVERDSATMDYGSVAVAHATLAEGAPFFVWYRARNGTMSVRQLRGSPARIVEVAPGGRILARVTVPRDSFADEQSPRWATVAESFSTQIVVPLGQRAIHAATSGEHGERPSTTEWILSLLGAVVFAAVNFRMSKRYAFPPRRLAAWTAIGFAFGLLGFVLFLTLVERPALETCPHCGRQRVVNRERCEHCGAPFAPPAMDGTEVFETRPAVVAEAV